VRLRGVRRRVVRGIRIRTRMKELRKERRWVMRIMGVTRMRMYIITMRWIHCRGVRVYRRFRRYRRRNSRGSAGIV